MFRLSNIQKSLSILKEQISSRSKPHLKEVYERYLHSYETRTLQQINATTLYMKKLSESNLQRLSSTKNKVPQFDLQKGKQCIFICLHGLPPFESQFQFLELPGKVYRIAPTGFQSKSDGDGFQQIFYKCRFSLHADKIRKIFDQNPQKEVVFIYHSFGTYFLSTYFHKFGTQRVKGLIEIGAAPIRQYTYLTEVANHVLRTSQKDLVENKDQVAGKKLDDLMERMNKQLNVKWDSFPSWKYGAYFLSYFKSPQSTTLFDLNRRYPNILKLMIFGQDDYIFEKDLICERADFYSKQKITLQGSLKKRFKQEYSIQTKNIQTNFIFMIPKGKHSLHLQKKNQPIIYEAVRQYLSLILN